MFLIPSILCYTDVEIAKKIEYLHSHQFSFKKQLQNSTSGLTLHLDFVGKNFARDRGVLQSCRPEIVFEKLIQAFGKKGLNVDVHLMSSAEDQLQDWQFFEKFQRPKAWNLSIFVDSNILIPWQIFFESKGYKIGVWMDLHQWSLIQSTETKKVVLMTVNAGKSGQMTTSSTKLEALNLIKMNPTKNIILDGGWGEKDYELLSQNNLPHQKFVSGSSFWNNHLV